MRQSRIDVSGMIRALEDYLAATRPSPPPEPPRAKTETESKLEKLLEDLSRPLPAPEPTRLQAPAVAQVSMEAGELAEPEPLSADPSRDEMVDNIEPAPILPRGAPESLEEKSPGDVAASDAAVEDDDVPTELPPQAGTAPESRPEPARTNWPLRAVLLSAVFALALAPMLLKRRPARIVAKTAPPTARTLPAPGRSESALPSDPKARALALVLAYRPSGGPVTAGEIFRSIAGDPIPDDNWEVREAGAGRFVVGFVPYRGTLGENYSYEFEVDARADRVRPRPDTSERLRVDALGRLAGRSDLQAFWQFLDLRR